jgi:hypothetical protein
MTRSTQWVQAVSVLVIGIGLGWLAGLSVSPVVGGIITSLLGIAAAVVTGLHAIRFDRGARQGDSSTPRVDARPAALLVLGIALAATLGILVRTHHLLEPRQPAGAVESSRNNQERGVLYGAYQDECNLVLGSATAGNYKAFITQLKASSIPCAREMVSQFQEDPLTLIPLIKTICRDTGSK